MKKRFVFGLMLVTLLAFFAAGCGNSAPVADPEIAAESTDVVVEPPASESTTLDTVSVVDSLGNEVLIPSEVTRVASMRSGITEIICALGEAEKIVAVDEMVKAGEMYGMFVTSIHPELMDADAPYAGRDINAEEMLRIAPDLVLHGGYGRIKQAEALKEQAPDLPIVIAHFETLDAYMDDIRVVARCVGAEDRAEVLITYLQSKLDFIAETLADVPDDEKVRVFYGGHDAYHAYGGETFEHAQIVNAGGVNVAESLAGWMPEVSPEQLLEWDPEVIVLLNGASVDEVLNDSKLEGLSAVANKRVYALPEAGWDFSSPRALFCIEWLATKFYPAYFSDVDIESEADEFYRNVFGVPYDGPALADSDTRIVTDMNGREVEIPAHPRRVVSVFPYVTFTTLALGGEDVLVAIDSMSAKIEKLAEVYPVVQDLPDVGTFFGLNEESVLLAEPDLILTASWHRDPDETQEKLGVPVLCADLNDYKESVAFIGSVLGGDAVERADELISYYDTKMAAVADALSAVDEKTTVYVGGGDGFLSTFGAESTWHYEVEAAGGVNVSADLVGGGSHEVSMEDIVLWDPDVIVLDQSCPDGVADVLADSRWESVTAVKEGRVYRSPAGFLDVWGRPHLETLLSRLWLADKCYPEAADLDMAAEAKEFYATVYGVELSDAEVEALLSAE